jgi:hypothetical protein
MPKITVAENRNARRDDSNVWFADDCARMRRETQTAAFQLTLQKLFRT